MSENSIEHARRETARHEMEAAHLEEQAIIARIADYCRAHPETADEFLDDLLPEVSRALSPGDRALGAAYIGKNEFEAQVRAITGSEAEMRAGPPEDITQRLSVAQYATDLLINAAERRGLLGEHNGFTVIPYEIPDGVEPVETLLTRAN